MAHSHIWTALAACGRQGLETTLDMIHPTAVIADGARLGQGVSVGPYTVVDQHVTLGDNCWVGPRVTLTGHTTVGAGTKIHSGAVVGDEPQDTHYDGAPTTAEVGANCVIREYVTIHRGAGEGTGTHVGDDCMLMAFAHVAHDCVLGDRVVMANGTTLAGHVQVGEAVFMSANVLIHQFVRVGALAMVGGGALVTQDVPPYCMLPRDGIQGPNVIGLKRAGMNPETRKAVRSAIKLYFFSGLNGSAALAAIREQIGGVPEVDQFVAFIEQSKRGITRGNAAQ